MACEHNQYDTCSGCYNLYYENGSFSLLYKATERLLAQYKKDLLKLYPNANVKQHSKGCTCEICEVEIALGKKEE